MFSYYTNLFQKVNWLKTIYFNFYYFPWKVARHLPVLVYNKTHLYHMGGRIKLEDTPYFGMVELGPHTLGIQDAKYARTIWDVRGTLVIKGQNHIGRGTHITIGKNGVLTLGKYFLTCGGSSIMCTKEISLGENSFLSWETLIMDTDYHPIYQDGRLINRPSPIHIGDKVWIGCRNTILKGVYIADNVIVAAGSVVTRSVDESDCVVGGSGKSFGVLKKGISWDRENFENYL